MKKLLIIFIVFLSLASCRTYYDMVFGFHEQLDTENFKAAQKNIAGSKFLKRNRNQILRCLELGKVFHLQQQYDSSNYYFNKADNLMDEKTVVADISLSIAANPSLTRYKGEDFEKVLVHYYKALNYLFLNNNEAALVEAKRINLRLNDLSDKGIMAGKKYKSDAFAHTLQGFIYERTNDYNNAFVAYRNAAELYEKSTTQEYLGTTIPLQLKKDLINSAHKSGFFTERDEYCTKYNLKFVDVQDTSKNSVLFIWENGLAPIKQQEDVFLYLVKGVGGQLVFSDRSGNFNIPFPMPENKKNSNVNLSDFNVIRLAYPKYIDVPLFYNGLSISLNNISYNTEVAENVTHIARKNLQEKALQEITLMTSRLVLKKLAEMELKKENEAAGAALGIVGALMEKADTRNWQSLPSFIAYTRIPVKKGINKLPIRLSSVNGRTYNDSIVYNSTSKLGVINYNTLKHFPPIIQ